MDIVFIIVKLLGSVGLFLYAMKLLSHSLQNSAGDKLEKILSAMTGNRFLSVFTGMISTAAVQSSTAITVMTVGFVNAGIFTLKQAIGVIMGANIGTTVTSWIVSTLGFTTIGSTSDDVTVIIAFVFLLVSFILSITKRSKLQGVSNTFVAVALIFVSLYFLKNAFPTSLINDEDSLSFLAVLKSESVLGVLACAIIGMVMTVLLQSSAAAMTITITASSLGLIGAYSACAMCLGQNIGTTFASVIASSSGGTNAKRAAAAHMLFNVFGSVLVLLFLKPFMSLVNLLTYKNIFALKSEALALELPVYLSMFHTAFNLLNTIILLPFVDQFALLITRIIPEKEGDMEEHYKFNYKQNLPFLSIPDAYLSVIRDEVVKLSSLSLGMVDDVTTIFQSQDSPNEEVMKRIEKKEMYADQMQEELIGFCVSLMGKSISQKHANILSAIVRIISELESITDSCFTLSHDAKKRFDNQLIFDQMAQNQVLGYLGKIHEYVQFIDSLINKKSSENILAISFNYENSLNASRAELVSIIEDRMEKSGNIKTELIEFDMIRHIEHIGNYCTNIAQAIAKTTRA